MIKKRVRTFVWLLCGLMVLAVSLIISVSSDIYASLHSEDKYRSQALSKKSVVGTFNPSLLSHRLIQWDETHGVARHDIAARAYGNTSRFLDEVKSRCHSTDRNEAFFRCANTILGKNFYYRASNPVTPAWAAGYSDCDLNVYLLIDAAASAGKNADIVYAPGHAFLSFLSEKTGLPNYWETTTDHNNGVMADLADDFYRKTPQHFYYSPFPAQVAERLYPALIIDETGKGSASEILGPLLKEYPDNPLLTDQLYSYKSEINAEDAEKIEDLLKTDTSSVSKKIIVARYFADRGDRDNALNFLNRIDDSNCGAECLSLKQHFSLYYRAIAVIINTANEHNVVIPFPLIAGVIAKTATNLYPVMLLVLFSVLVSLTVLRLLSIPYKKPMKSASFSVQKGTLSGSQESAADKPGSPPSSAPEH